MRISLKVDYAIRALAELSASESKAPMKADDIARGQSIPLHFLLRIMNELKRSRLVTSHRGVEGGFSLARDARDISVADVIRAIDGPLANVHDSSLSTLTYTGAAASLPEVWMALRTSLRNVLEAVSLTDLVGGRLPAHVREMAATYKSDDRYKT